LNIERSRTSKASIVNGTVRYCGPATARLSVFAGVTFRNGSCRQTTVAGAPLFTVKLGQRTQSAATNSGRAYFGLSVSGPFSHPSSGGVIVYWKGKRWGGPGISFKGNAHAGTFVARGINGSRGKASGSYRCS
jgi:hypothetical protein